MLGHDITADSISQDILKLRQRSACTGNVLERAQQSLESLEATLEQFLDDYYQQVGAGFQTLLELEELLLAAEAGRATNAFPDPAPLPFSADQKRFSLQREIKQMYWQMARQCHPDHRHGGALHDGVMAELNQAYASQNLREMWKIRWDLERQAHGGTLSHTQRLELLTAQHRQMQQALTAIRRRETAIRESDAYRLMQHAQMLKLCGQDFIALVKRQVEWRIFRLQNQLIRARVRQKQQRSDPQERAEAQPHPA